jgi:hypothetical protein
VLARARALTSPVNVLSRTVTPQGAHFDADQEENTVMEMVDAKVSRTCDTYHTFVHTMSLLHHAPITVSTVYRKLQNRMRRSS